MNDVLGQITSVYDLCAQMRHKKHLVSHDLFLELSKTYRSLKTRAKERIESDEDWMLYLRRLRDYIYIFSGIPLPFSSSKILPTDFLATLSRNYARLSVGSAGLMELAEDALGLLKGLTEVAGNPLFNAVKELLPTFPRDMQPAILITKARYLSVTQEFISARLPHIKVITPHALCSTTCYDSLVMLGSPSWYPPYVFAAPRTANIHSVCFDWLYSAPHSGVSLLATDSPHKKETVSLSTMDDWHPTVKRAVSHFIMDKDDDAYAEDVAATLYFLDSGKAVFLENDDNAKAYVLDLNEGLEDDGDSRISKRLVEEIHTGTFLLLRTSGGGDYIPEVADSIMGRSAKPAREKQDLWKNALSEFVKTQGIHSAARMLRANGSQIANPTNLRNWMSRRNIRTDDRKEFDAIMKGVGLFARADELWQNAEHIESAHRSAGMKIRKLLLQEVCKSDLKALENAGYMEFTLHFEGMPGGSIGAFRVLGASREKQQVPWHKIARPFSLEDDLWRE